MSKQKTTTIIFSTFALLIFVACGLLADKVIKEKNAENAETTTEITAEVSEEETVDNEESKEENVKEALEYLKNKYGREFKIIEDKNMLVWNMGILEDEDILGIYMATPVDDENLTFNICKVKNYKTGEIIFKDTYFEAVKECVAKKYIDPEGYFVIGNATANQVTQQVYTLMTQINDELKVYGITTDETTCSITMKFLINNSGNIIDFDELNYDKIYEQIELVLFNNNN